MNDDLHTSLDRAVDDAVAQAAPPEQIHRTVAQRIRDVRRRRPALVIGSTLGGLALVGGTAFAAVQLLGDDARHEVPDVISAPRPDAPEPSAEPTEEPTPEPVETEPEPEPAPVLPPADPAAVFPACGAVVDARTGSQLILLDAPDAALPLGPTLDVRALNEELRAGHGQMSDTPYLVAVKDGVVVGTSSAEPTEIPFEMFGDGGIFPTTTGTIETTLCSDPLTPLPEGRYSVWAAQDFTFNQKVLWGKDVDDPIIHDGIDEPYRALSEVAGLWMDAEGRSTGHPGLAPGWPQALSHEAAFAADNAEPETVVWLATSTQRYSFAEDAALIPTRDALKDLGYTETDIPFQCQAGLDAIGVVEGQHEYSYGTGLIFPSANDAQLFTDLWEPLHGPVLGVVTGYVGVGSVPVGYQHATSVYKHCTYPNISGYDSAAAKAADEAQGTIG